MGTFVGTPLGCAARSTRATSGQEHAATNIAQITIVGNVANVPELRTLADGRQRTRFRVAATSRVLDPRTGLWRDSETTFLAVVAWRGLAGAAAGLSRGTRVVVIGHLRQFDYARDGQRDMGYEVQAQESAVGLTVPRSSPSTPTSTANARV